MFLALLLKSSYRSRISSVYSIPCQVTLPKIMYSILMMARWTPTVEPPAAATWSGVPSHVARPDSWSLPQPAPPAAAPATSWGGDDWSSDDESVRDTRLMPPPAASAGGQATGRQLTQAKPIGQGIYGGSFHPSRSVMSQSTPHIF